MSDDTQPPFPLEPGSTWLSQPPNRPAEGPSGPFGPPAWPAPPQPQPAARGTGPWRRRVGAAGLVAAIAVGSGATGAVLARELPGTSASAVTTAAPVSVGSSAAAPSEQLAKVAAAVEPSVVSIKVDTANGGDEGSGIILRSDGTILTNNHVIAAAANGGGTISVKFADGKSASATIVGRDPTTDLAVIRASGVSGLTPATLGSVNSVHVGDTVLAIGSPLGLEGSVSAGIVSALHRTVSLQSEQPPQSQTPQGLGGQGWLQQQSPQQPTQPSASVGDAIQTDAAINPGNSGGPLVDVQGRVIGINTAIATMGGSLGGQSGSIGVGFAIPIDEARTVADQLMAGKTVQHAQLGVQITDAQSGGALISSVSSGSPAAKAGLKSGDVVTQVDNTPISSADDLAAAIRTHTPGDVVTIHYTRSGQQHTARATLANAGS